jgi:hypothetical protein
MSAAVSRAIVQFAATQPITRNDKASQRKIHWLAF